MHRLSGRDLASRTGLRKSGGENGLHLVDARLARKARWSVELARSRPRRQRGVAGWKVEVGKSAENGSEGERGSSWYLASAHPSTDKVAHVAPRGYFFLFFSLFFSFLFSPPLLFPPVGNSLSLSISNRVRCVRSRSKTTKTRRVGSEVGLLLVENSRHRLSFPPSALFPSVWIVPPSSRQHPTTLLSLTRLFSPCLEHVTRTSFYLSLSVSLVESPTIPEFPTWSIRLVHQPRALSRHACSRACTIAAWYTAKRTNFSFFLFREDSYSLTRDRYAFETILAANCCQANHFAPSMRACSTLRRSPLSIFAKAKQGKHLCVVPVWSIRI